MEQNETESSRERQRAPWNILCIGCDKSLSLEERRVLKAKGLSTFKKQVRGRRNTYGCCTLCRWALAAREANIAASTEITLEADGVLIFEGKSLEDIDVNCRFCLGFLRLGEKRLNRDLQLPFVHRRGRWRGICSECLCSEYA